MGVRDFFRRIGRGIARGAKAVGSWIKGAAEKVGRWGKPIVEIAKKVAPFVKNIPIVGTAVNLISKGGDVVDIVKRIGSGDIRGALAKTADVALGSLPVVGQIKSAAEMAGLKPVPVD